MPTRTKRTPQAARLITLREVAEIMSCNRSTLRSWVERGDFPRPLRVIGRTWLYRAKDIEQFCESGKWPAGVKFGEDQTIG